MSEQSGGDPVRKKRRRLRWLQFDLRMAMLAILLVAVALAWLTRPETLVEPLAGGAGRIERQVVRDDEDRPRNHGRWRLFDADGRLLVDGAYRGGKPHGRWTYYDAAGEWFVADAAPSRPDEAGGPPAEPRRAGVPAPPDANAIISRWIARMREGRAAERKQSAWALARIGQPAVPHVTALLGDDDPAVRLAAAETLAAIGSPTAASIEALTDAVADEHADVALAAVEALGRIGPAARDALPALLRRAQQAADDDERAVFLAAQASIDPADPAPIRELLLLRPAHGDDILPPPDPNTAPEYWQLLWPLVYEQRPNLAPALATALADDDVRIARLAVRALIELRGDHPAASAALCQALRDPRVAVRLEAIAALDKSYGPLDEAIRAALASAAAEDKSADVRAAAKEASERARNEYPMVGGS